MITIFSCPKSFRGHIGVIQRNAVRSWALLKPRPEIILVGDDEGVGNICREFDLVHIKEIETNEFGTPLVNSIFRVCQERAKFAALCYVNSDIILMSDFMPAVAKVITSLPRYLMIGGRWDLDIAAPLDFTLETWESQLVCERERSGRMHSEKAMDYFVFPRGTYTNMPPLAIGRLAWDNWLVWRARSKFMPVVDATAAAKIVHQNHDYAPGVFRAFDGVNAGENARQRTKGPLRRFDGSWVILGPEAERNDALVPEDIREFGMRASTWVISQDGKLRKRPLSLNPVELKYQVRYVWPLYSRSLGWAISRVVSLGSALRKNRKLSS